MQCESIRVNHRTPALKGCHASAQPSERWTPVSKYLRPEPDTGSRRCHQHSRFISETFFCTFCNFQSSRTTRARTRLLIGFPRCPAFTLTTLFSFSYKNLPKVSVTL